MGAHPAQHDARREAAERHQRVSTAEDILQHDTAAAGQPGVACHPRAPQGSLALSELREILKNARPCRPWTWPSWPSPRARWAPGAHAHHTSAASGCGRALARQSSRLWALREMRECERATYRLRVLVVDGVELGLLRAGLDRRRLALRCTPAAAAPHAWHPPSCQRCRSCRRALRLRDGRRPRRRRAAAGPERLQWGITLVEVPLKRCGNGLELARGGGHGAASCASSWPQVCKASETDLYS